MNTEAVSRAPNRESDCPSGHTPSPGREGLQPGQREHRDGLDLALDRGHFLAAASDPVLMGRTHDRTNYSAGRFRLRSRSRAGGHGLLAWVTAVGLLTLSSAWAADLDLVLVGEWSSGSDGRHPMEVHDGLVYCASAAGGLAIIDIRGPVNPRRIGGNPNLTAPVAVAVASGKVFAADNEEGLVIFNQYEPIRFEQLVRGDRGALYSRVAGPPGVPRRVQRSSDLGLWSDWQSLDFEEIPLEISDPNTSSKPAGFYHLVAP